jgi:hypothetical protein
MITVPMALQAQGRRQIRVSRDAESRAGRRMKKTITANRQPSASARKKQVHSAGVIPHEPKAGL